jgi:hypothetical protein
MLDFIVDHLKNCRTGTIFHNYISIGVEQNPEGLILELYDQIKADSIYGYKNIAALIGMNLVHFIKEYVEKGTDCNNSLVSEPSSVLQ